MTDARIAIDLSAELERLRVELRDELLETLRDERRWPEFMDIRTAAAYLDVPVERLRKLKERGAVAFIQERRGARVFFKRSDLIAFMDDQRVEARRGAA